MNPIAEWILANIQIDLGNLVIGIATIIIAIVTLRTTMANIRMEANHRIASFRINWIEELRTHVSKFIGAAHIVKNRALGEAHEELETLHTDIMRIETYILMMLDMKDPVHRQLSDEIEQTRDLLGLFSLSRDPQVGTQIDLMLKQIPQTASLILKSEWDRASTEIKKKN